MRISIHAPRVGSDHTGHAERRKIHYISIHAPRVGSDYVGRHLDRGVAEFLSTLPAWGATRRGVSCYLDNLDFYPRSPRGERRWPMFAMTGTKHFYPRSPRGERHLLQGQAHLSACISIHAPRVGSDQMRTAPICWAFCISIHAPRVGSDQPWGPRPQPPKAFLSTLPAWGATTKRIFRAKLRPISIHAPRVGSDNKHCKLSRNNRNFYPRSPRGERL